jgi:DNA repair exonuclease SbcCD ATPase subunit
VAVREKEELEHRNRELSNRLSKLEQEWLQRQTGDNRAVQELLKELQEEKAAHLVTREEKQSLERKVDRLTTEKQALDDALRLAEQRRAQAQSTQLLQLESELDSLRDPLTMQRIRAAEEKATLSQELQDEKTARLQQQAEAREEQNALRDRMQTLERKLERAAAEKQALEDVLRAAERQRGEGRAAEMRLLETELKNVRDTLAEERVRAAEEKNAIRQQLARLEERYRGVTAENEAAFQRAEAYSRDLTAARETIRAQKDRVRDLEKRLAQASESEEVEAPRDEIGVLKTQLKYLQPNRPYEGMSDAVEAGAAPGAAQRQAKTSELHGIIDDIHETFKSTVRSQQHTIDRLQSKGQRTYESPTEVDELAPIVSDMRLYLQKARGQVRLLFVEFLQRARRLIVMVIMFACRLPGGTSASRSWVTSWHRRRLVALCKLLARLPLPQQRQTPSTFRTRVRLPICRSTAR